jgi:hypothetical protein
MLNTSGHRFTYQVHFFALYFLCRSFHDLYNTVLEEAAIERFESRLSGWLIGSHHER